jgi:hypothetical protein
MLYLHLDEARERKKAKNMKKAIAFGEFMLI